MCPNSAAHADARGASHLWSIIAVARRWPRTLGLTKGIEGRCSMKGFISFLASLLFPSLFFCSIALAYVPPKGVQFELVEFQSGGRIVQGGIFSPDPKVFGKSTIAVVLVHGTESYWYSGPPMFLGSYLAEQGYVALGYNGVHSGETFRTSEFETAVQEVGDAIRLMKERGFEKIFLVGHSLGTPIIEYYQGDKPDPSV